MSRKPAQPPRFDREAFFLGTGVGIVTIAVGSLIVWGTLTAPDSPSRSTGFTTAQRLARVLPRSVQEKLALALAALLIVFGLVVFVRGLWEVIRYIGARAKS